MNTLIYYGGLNLSDQWLSRKQIHVEYFANTYLSIKYNINKNDSTCHFSLTTQNMQLQCQNTNTFWSRFYGTCNQKRLKLTHT
jgi:hypothetical protein